MTNVTFHLSCDPSRFLYKGKPPADLQDSYWHKKVSVATLQSNNKGRFDDNLCGFRAVAVFFEWLKNPNFHPKRIGKKAVEDMYFDFKDRAQPLLPENPTEYGGCSLSTMRELCVFNKLNVVIFGVEVNPSPSDYSYQPEAHTHLGRILCQHCVRDFKETIHLIDYKGHCMVIHPKKLKNVFDEYRCTKCSYNPRFPNDLNRHVKTCSEGEFLSFII